MKKFYLEVNLKDERSCKGCRMLRRSYSHIGCVCEETGFDIKAFEAADTVRPEWCPLKEDVMPNVVLPLAGKQWEGKVFEIQASESFTCVRIGENSWSWLRGSHNVHNLALLSPETREEYLRECGNKSPTRLEVDHNSLNRRMLKQDFEQACNLLRTCEDNVDLTEEENKTIKEFLKKADAWFQSKANQ